MIKKELKVALIGCGRVAGHHCSSIASVPGVKLAAVCDLDMDKAQNYAQQYGVPAYKNFNTMMRDNLDLDIVSIITPSGMHKEHALEIISRYQKHVVVEKPTFMRPDNAREVFECASAHGVSVFPVFQNRYNKAVQRVRKAIADREIGDIRIISIRVRWCRPQRYYDLAPWRGTYSHDGGALTNQCIHHLDLLRYLGGQVTRVNATMKTLGADIEVEDTAVATLELESGAVGVLEGTTAARPDDFEASISFVGSKGLAQIGGIAVNELQIFTPDPLACATSSEDFVGIEGHGAVYGYGHSKMYTDIIAHLLNKSPYPVGRDDCLGTLYLLHSLYASDEAGDWVRVAEEAISSRLGRANSAISELYRTVSPKPEI